MSDEQDSQRPPQDPPRRAIKSFVTRAGRMGTGQIKALAELGPKFVLPYKAERIAAEAVFGRKGPLVLEIG
ncbi:MAG TPA: tRNA (guanosine(46)-N7)-methyltransferase TrmB, partial [Roseateles sp.]